MRSVIQRVDTARVLVNGTLVSSIGVGLLAYVGIARGDRKEDAKYLADKILNLRIFEDLQNKMNLSLLDIRGEIMVISQFTLAADCRRGRRPSFAAAENPKDAIILYNYFVKLIKDMNGSVSQGVFQTMMSVESINNGPITILLDSKRGF